MALDELGSQHDREWMLVQTDGIMMTQRQFPKMALIKPEIDSDQLRPATPVMPSPVVASPTAAQEIVPTEVWGDACAGIDQGDEAANWFAHFLQTSCRLLRNDRFLPRYTKTRKPDGSAARVSFVDSCPLLVLSEETLVDLNDRLPEPAPVDRFGQSIVIRGLGRLSEHEHAILNVSGMRLFSAKPCARCVITTVDQQTRTMCGPGAFAHAEPVQARRRQSDLRALLYALTPGSARSRASGYGRARRSSQAVAVKVRKIGGGNAAVRMALSPCY